MRWKTVLGVALAFSLVACERQDDGDGDRLKVYRHSEDQSPTTIDPVQAATIYTNIAVINLYDTLYRYKYLERPYAVAPNVAESLPDVSEDGLTYTIKIKPGNFFVDDPSFEDGVGRELVAEDFVYSIKRHFDPDLRPQGAWLWQGRIVGLDEWKAAGSDYGAEIEGLRALDDHTLQIKLIKPYPQLIFTLTQGFSAAVPHEAVSYYGRQFGTKAVGTGPFKLESFTSAKIVMSRNEKFRREPLDLDYEGYDESAHAFTGIAALAGKSPPFIDRLEIDFIAETSARWNSFTKGNEIQYTLMPKEQANTVLASRNPVRLKPDIDASYHSSFGLQSDLVYVGFNMDDENIGHSEDPQRDHRNRELRCAIRDGYDWQRRNETFYFGLGEVYPGAIPPVVPEFDPALDRDSVTLDVERARRRLAEAGWTAENLPLIDYGAPGDLTSRQTFEQQRAFMTAIGIPKEKIKFTSYPTFGDFNQAVKQRKLMMFALGWNLDYPDAENTLQLFYGPNATPRSNNFNYANPAYDELFETAQTMPSSPERTAIYHQLNQLIIDDCVFIGGLSRTRILLWHKDVVGYPDQTVVGGFWLRFVDVKSGGSSG